MATLSGHVEWWEGVMKDAGRCAACEQDTYFNTPGVDFEAAMPSSYNHNPESLGCKRNPKSHS